MFFWFILYFFVSRCSWMRCSSSWCSPPSGPTWSCTPRCPSRRWPASWTCLQKSSGTWREKGKWLWSQESGHWILLCIICITNDSYAAGFAFMHLDALLVFKMRFWLLLTSVATQIVARRKSGSVEKRVTNFVSSRLRNHLLAFKHKMKNVVWTKGTSGLCYRQFFKNLSDGGWNYSGHPRIFGRLFIFQFEVTCHRLYNHCLRFSSCLQMYSKTWLKRDVPFNDLSVLLPGLEGEFQSGSEVDFYIDKNMIHIADTKVK